MRNGKSGIIVMLDIFSGRPNPAWSLSRGQIDELGEKVQNLPSVTPVTPPGLGYRGFVVRQLGARVFKVDRRLPDQMRAYRSILAITDWGNTSYHQDVNRVEEWLLAQARDKGYWDVIERFSHPGNSET